MNFDPGGVLNTILSAVSPSGPIQPNMADGVEKKFSDFLEQMRAVVGQRSSSGPPLESGEWNLRLQPQALAENLQILQRYVETLAAGTGEGAEQSRMAVERLKASDTATLDGFLTKVRAAFLRSIQDEPVASHSIAQTDDAPRPDQVGSVDIIHLLSGLAAELEREGTTGPALAGSFLAQGDGETAAGSEVQDSGDGSPALPFSWQWLDVGPGAGPGSLAGFPAAEETKAGSNQGGGSLAAVMPQAPLETAPPGAGTQPGAPEAGEFAQFPEVRSETPDSEAVAALSRDELVGGADDPSSGSSPKEVPDAVVSVRESRPVETAAPGGSEKSSQRPLLDLSRPFDHPQWPDELGQRLLWMHGKTMQVAELRVNPQHLGPIEVRIEMQGDQTTIQFTSHHAVVREAIESALPRLRELFGLQQLQLAQVDVSGQSLSDQPQSSPRRDSAEGGYGSGGTADMAEERETLETGERRLPVSGNRLLSLYA